MKIYPKNRNSESNTLKIKVLEEENNYLKMEIESLKETIKLMDYNLKLHEQSLREISKATDMKPMLEQLIKGRHIG